MSSGLTEEIFKLKAPYANPYQGDDIRVLFVCSAGLLRSATGANLYAKKGFNTRSCGSADYALTPLSANLIMWADKIVFVNAENYEQAINNFNGKTAATSFIEYDLGDEMAGKSLVLDIPDRYEYNHPALINHFEDQLDAANLSRK